MKKNNILFILISAVLLCFFAFYNRFPLVFWDTATYISMGFKGELLMERPIFYGLFIRHISFSESLWFVIYTQGIILSLILYLYFKYFLVDINNKNIYFLIYSAFIVFFTGASYYTSRLMPDAFTPIFILSLGLLFFVKGLTKFEKIYISVILVISAIMHNTHIMMFLIVMFLTFLVYIIFKFKKINFFNNKRLILLVGLFLISYSSSYFASWTYRGKFESFKGSHVFMMGRLISTGILQDYLKNNCDDNTYSLCKYQDNISTSFLWDVKNSPLYKDGGWEGTKEKYTKLIYDIFSNPKYLKSYFIKSVEASASQFFYFDIPHDRDFNDGTFLYSMINNHYKDYVIYYKQSLQNQKRLNIVDGINSRQQFVFIFSFLFIITFLFTKKGYKSLTIEMRFIFIFIILFLIINSILVGFFSEVRFRYQGRIIWLVSLPVFLYFANNFSNMLKKLKSYLYKK